MHHLEKNSTIFSPEGPRENVSLYTAVAFDGSVSHQRSLLKRVAALLCEM